MTQFTLPTSRIVTQDWAQDFSWLNGVYYPNGFYSSLGWKGHNGIDYGCWEGDPVEAVCDGVIEYVGPGNGHPLLSGGGNTILLRNDELGMRFEYLHLSQQNVYTTQRVTRGQVIGLSGNTGTSTAPHLHLGAIPVGYVNQNDGWRGRIDPTPYLYGPMNPEFSGIAAQGGIQASTGTEEDDMASAEWLATVIQAVARTEDMVKEVRNRVIGRDVQRYYNPQTLEVRTEPFAGSTPARTTDVHDIISTNNLIVSQSNKILDAVAKVPGVDATVLAGLRQELSEELKASVANLSITFVPDTRKES